MSEKSNGDGWVGLPMMRNEHLKHLTSNRKDYIVVEHARRAIWGRGVHHVCVFGGVGRG